MQYSLEIEEKLDKSFSKLRKKDLRTYEALSKKVDEILEYPHRYKPLRAPMQNCRRVHISGSFVLVYRIDEQRRTVKLLEFEHHDRAYR